MNSELLNIYNEHRVPIGVATRGDVHKYGYWHETFHCWFISSDVNNEYIYFQLRSENKRDYPNLLDITAAGHLLSNETVEDGIREVKEETGIDVSIHDLIPLGVMDYVVTTKRMIDKEFAHVYLHHYNGTLDDFSVQREEVSRIFIAKFYDFFDLWMDNTNEIDIHGFSMDGNGNKVKVNKVVSKAQFVPHHETFYKCLVNQMNDILANRKEELMKRRKLLAEISEKLASKPLIGNENKYGPDLEPILRYFPRENPNVGFDWCAAFVYHCCSEAGVKLPVRYPEPVTRNFAWVEAWLEWGKLHGFYHHISDQSFVPLQGDLIVFDNVVGNGTNDHIGIVLGTEQDKIITAEGNYYNKSGIFQRTRDQVNGYIRIDESY